MYIYIIYIIASQKYTLMKQKNLIAICSFFFSYIIFLKLKLQQLSITLYINIYWDRITLINI